MNTNGNIQIENAIFTIHVRPDLLIQISAGSAEAYKITKKTSGSQLEDATHAGQFNPNIKEGVSLGGVKE